jgi:tetratricopeptide (TPR) repeat protein
VLIVAVLCVATLSRSYSQERESGIRAYHELLTAYHRGDEGSVKRLGGWKISAVADAIDAIEGRSDPVTKWEPWRFRAAAMLSAEVALASSSTEQSIFHLGAAGAILQRGGAETAEFASRFYEAVARSLRVAHRTELAIGVLNAARERMPHDPRVLYESGVTLELRALSELVSGDEPRWTSTSMTMGDHPGGDVGRFRVPTVTRNRNLGEHDLANAELFFKDALKNGSQDPLARLHLARIQAVRAHGHEALPQLDALLAASKDPAVCYLANLIAGSIFESQGHLTDAIGRYQAAAKDFPDGQAANVAAAEALQRDGRIDEARETLERWLTASRPDGVREPWWAYVLDSDELARALVDALRREAQQP